MVERVKALCWPSDTTSSLMNIGEKTKRHLYNLSCIYLSPAYVVCGKVMFSVVFVCQSVCSNLVGSGVPCDLPMMHWEGGPTPTEDLAGRAQTGKDYWKDIGGMAQATHPPEGPEESEGLDPPTPDRPHIGHASTGKWAVFLWKKDFYLLMIIHCNTSINEDTSESLKIIIMICD